MIAYAFRKVLKVCGFQNYYFLKYFFRLKKKCPDIPSLPTRKEEKKRRDKLNERKERLRGERKGTKERGVSTE